MALHWMTGEGWQCAYGREHGYLVLTTDREVRLSRFPVNVAAAGLVARVAREATASVVIFPLGRGSGRPGMAPELAALASSARHFAECYESGESLPGYPAWQCEAEPEAVSSMVFLGPNRKRFSCERCHANVFTRCGNVFTCNGCGVQYEGTSASVGSADDCPGS